MNSSLRDAMDDATRHLEPLADIDQAIQTAQKHRRIVTGATAIAAVVCAVLAFGVVNLQSGTSEPQPLEPPPGIEVGDVPVWFDKAGLHRGDIVEETPVERMGALALVRTGALYQDRQTLNVWFHPWGGEPRVVGRNVIGGPGGDPEGDIAAWFEQYELVVYDTATGRELSRTEPDAVIDGNCPFMCAEHYPTGSNFLQVSADQLVWGSGDGEAATTYDMQTQETETLSEPIVDVHGEIEVVADYEGESSVLLKQPGWPTRRYTNLEARARISPTGDYVLAVEERNHHAALIDVATGEPWYVRRIDYPWIAWSYGNVALIDTKQKLLACDVAVRTCETLSAERRVLMPTT